VHGHKLAAQTEDSVMLKGHQGGPQFGRHGWDDLGWRYEKANRFSSMKCPLGPRWQSAQDRVQFILAVLYWVLELDKKKDRAQTNHSCREVRIPFHRSRKGTNRDFPQHSLWKAPALLASPGFWGGVSDACHHPIFSEWI
jgi:hypothetical protein